MSFTAKAPRGTAPDYGSFPLDREQKCNTAMHALVACLRREKGVHAPCKHLSRKYMECRAGHDGLMTVITHDNLDDHGMSAEEIERSQAKGASIPYRRDKEKDGYVAGTGEVSAMHAKQPTPYSRK